MDRPALDRGHGGEESPHAPVQELHVIETERFGGRPVDRFIGVGVKPTGNVRRELLETQVAELRVTRADEESSDTERHCLDVGDFGGRKSGPPARLYVV